MKSNSDKDWVFTILLIMLLCAVISGFITAEFKDQVLTKRDIQMCEYLCKPYSSSPISFSTDHSSVECTCLKEDDVDIIICTFDKSGDGKFNAKCTVTE